MENTVMDLEVTKIFMWLHVPFLSIHLSLQITYEEKI